METTTLIHDYWRRESCLCRSLTRDCPGLNLKVSLKKYMRLSAPVSDADLCACSGSYTYITGRGRDRTYNTLMGKSGRGPIYAESAPDRQREADFHLKDDKPLIQKDEINSTPPPHLGRRISVMFRRFGVRWEMSIGTCVLE